MKHVTPASEIVEASQWHAHKNEWLPTDEDRAYVGSLMATAVTEPGMFANWIAPPSRGINQQPVNFQYVCLD